MKKILLTFLVIIASSSTFAYTPELWMIIQRTLKNNGNGVYKVSQDLVFVTEKEPLIVNETWYIENSETMRLQVRGKRLLKDKIKFSIVYSKGKKTFVDENNKIRTTKIGDDFYMQYLTFRFESKLRKFLLADNIISSKTTTKKPLVFKEDNSEYKPEPYLALGRTNGVISYVVSNPAISEGPNKPKLWIEQDQFLIRRIRFESGAEVKSDGFNKHSRGYYVPKFKAISWSDKNVQVNTLKVSRLIKGNKVKKLLYNKKLTLEKDGSYDFKKVSAPIIEEFYSRFR